MGMVSSDVRHASLFLVSLSCVASFFYFEANMYACAICFASTMAARYAFHTAAVPVSDMLPCSASGHLFVLEMCRWVLTLAGKEGELQKDDTSVECAESNAFLRTFPVVSEPRVFLRCLSDGIGHAIAVVRRRSSLVVRFEVPRLFQTLFWLLCCVVSSLLTSVFLRFVNRVRSMNGRRS